MRDFKKDPIRWPVNPSGDSRRKQLQKVRKNFQAELEQGKEWRGERVKYDPHGGG